MTAFWRLFQPWAGMVAGVLAAAFAHQFGSDATFDNCQRFAPLPLLLVAALCLVAALAGAVVSLGVLRRAPAQSSDKVVAVISVGFALLAGLAIILPMIGALILPPCFQ